MMPLRDITAHMRACYPAEGCGLVFRGADGALRFTPVTNVAGASDMSTRTRLDGYVMDPKELFKALQGADDAGGSLYAIVHSHPDVGAYFSKEDRRAALDDTGEPLYPGVLYLVVSVRTGTVDEARFFGWDAASRDFQLVQVFGIADFT